MKLKKKQLGFVRVQEPVVVVPPVGPGFPLPASVAIGGGTETEDASGNKWGETAVGSLTWHVAAHDIAFLNWVYPADINAGRPAFATNNLRTLNSGLLLGCYQNCRALSTGANDVNNILPYLVNPANFFKGGSGGAANGDGMARRINGDLDPTFPGKIGDVLQTTDSATDINGWYPATWLMVQEYDEVFGPGQVSQPWEYIYWDSMNWSKRVEQWDQDWNRDGVATNTDWDGINGTQGPELVINICNVQQLQHFGRLMGYEDTGLNRPSGNFERAFKAITRSREWIATDPQTGTKAVMPGAIIDTTVLSNTARYTIARYLVATKTIAGVYCCYMRRTAERSAEMLDEYVATDFSSLATMTQVNDAKHWLGQPKGDFPMYGDVFSSGVRGGLLGGSGVYAMEFDNGLVLTNPKGNGTAIVTLPAGEWERFLGGQDPTVNDGSAVGATLEMADATGLFLKRSSIIGFPRLAAPVIGAGSRTARWSQTAYQSDTWKLAMHDLVIINLNPSVDNLAAAQTAVATLRGHNPTVQIGQYYDAWEISSNPLGDDWANHLPTLQSYLITGFDGGTNADGLSRDLAGALITTWPNKYGINGTSYTGQVNGRYALEYMMEERFQEWHDPAMNLNLDFAFWDIGRWFGRSEEEGDVDWDRNGVVETYGNFDGATAPNLQISIATLAGYNRVNALYNTQYSVTTGIVQGWNAGSNWDWWDGARSDTGPTIITAASQPVDWPAKHGIQYQEHSGRKSGYNDDGSDNAGGNLRRGFSTMTRARDYVNVNPLTGTKCITPQACIDDADPNRYAKQRYLMSMATVAGVYCALENDGPIGSHREAALIDEYVADDIFSLTTAELLAARHWLGQGIGAFPSFGDTYIDNVQGGLIQNGIYGMKFVNGFVLCNPKGNGTQSVDITAFGSFTRFVGGQSPSVNSGANITGSISMGDATGLFLLNQ
jgi:hypothetical protein